MRLKKLLFIIIPLVLNNAIITCQSKRQQIVSDLLTDREMIDTFLLQKEQFEKLKNHILNDNGFRYYPFIGRGHDLEYESQVTNINKDYYARAIDSLKITDIGKAPGGGIFFDYIGKGDSTWGIDKGYYYKEGEIKETDDEKIVTGDLWEKCKELGKNNCTLYKKIEGNWYLFLKYDK